jgi:hypothetical protein
VGTEAGETVWRVGHEGCWRKLELGVEIDEGSTGPKRAAVDLNRLTSRLSVQLSVCRSRAAAPPVVRSLSGGGHDIVGHGRAED